MTTIPLIDYTSCKESPQLWRFVVHVGQRAELINMRKSVYDTFGVSCEWFEYQFILVRTPIGDHAEVEAAVRAYVALAVG